MYADNIGHSKNAFQIIEPAGSLRISSPTAAGPKGAEQEGAAGPIHREPLAVWGRSAQGAPDYGLHSHKTRSPENELH